MYSRKIPQRAVLAAVLPVSFVTSSLASDKLEELVVTATRTPVNLKDTLSSVSTIDRSDLEIQQPLDLVDAFQQSPSLDISRSGGPGSAASLYTRGTGSGHTLFLVDGQRVGSATLGSTNFQFISPEQIERIEVVRGPQSTLYGSDAIGGVVQMFSRDGSSGDDSYISAGTGSHNLIKLAAGTSGSVDNWRYGLHAAGLNTKGIDNLEDNEGRNGDDDGYRNYSLSASTGYRFDNGADLALRVMESDNRNEYDSAFSPETSPYSRSRIRNIALNGNLPLTRYWSSKLSVGQSTDKSKNYDDVNDQRSSYFRTRRYQVFWQNDFTLSEGHLLSLGYDFYREKVSGDQSYVEDERDNDAVFAQYQGEWSIFSTVLGLREDDHESFGNHTTGSIALGMAIGSSHKVVASWSEGFKAPTFNDLYWPAGAFSAGNPDLKPEQSKNSEIALRGFYTRWQWSLAAFENRIDDLIAWAAGPDFVWRPYNVNNAKISGAELTGTASFGPWEVSSAFTWLEPEDRRTGNELPNRSKTNLALSARRSFTNWWLALDLKNQGKRYKDAANTVASGSYTTAGLRLGYSISNSLDTVLRIDNLFDEDYQLNDGYNQDGRHWQLGLTWRL